MQAITAFIDGPMAGPELLASLHSALAALFPSGVELARPAAPNRAEFAELLAAARVEVEHESRSRMTEDDVPSHELMSALAKVELLETARLMLCNVERAWCATAMSRRSALRVNLCMDSELYAMTQTLGSQDTSDECKAVARAISGLGAATTPSVLHVYVGDTSDAECAAYVELANERTLRVATTNDLEGAVAAVAAAIRRATQAVKIDTSEFF